MITQYQTSLEQLGPTYIQVIGLGIPNFYWAYEIPKEVYQEATYNVIELISKQLDNLVIERLDEECWFTIDNQFPQNF